MYYINYSDHRPLQHRVVSSAYLLDSKKPGWATKIDLAELRRGKDVLEQLWGSHEKGVQELGVIESEHGFRPRYMHETPEELKKCWEFQVFWRLPQKPPREWMD